MASAGVGTPKGSPFTLEIDMAALLRVETQLARWRDPQLQRILRGAALTGARVLRPALRAGTPSTMPALAKSVRIVYSRKSNRA